MFTKTYQKKPMPTKAIQYDGTAEMAEDLAGNCYYLLISGSTLYFTGDGEYEGVNELDWILIDDKANATEIVEDDRFDFNYQEVK